MGSILVKFLLLLIKFYQSLISPLLPARCRFYPTCSNYGLEAIRLHGAFKGGRLTIRRVCRCHPWGGSGIDFVPLPLYRYHYYFVGKQAIGTGEIGVWRNFI